MAIKEPMSAQLKVEVKPELDAVGYPYTNDVYYRCKSCGAHYSEDGFQFLSDRYLGGCAKCGRLNFEGNVTE